MEGGYEKTQIKQEQAHSRKNSRKRWLIIATSSLLLVAVVIGVVVGVNNQKRNKNDNNNDASAGELATGSKAIEAACNMTTFPDVCTEELLKNPKSFTANPRELVSIAVQIALEHVEQSHNLATNLSSESGGRTESFAVTDCMELMDSAKDYLRESLAQLSSLSLKGLSEELYDVLVWLSTSGSHEQACMEGFNDVPTTEAGPRSEAMRKNQEKLSKLIIVAMGLVNSLSKLGKDLSSWKNSASNLNLHRRLLSINEFDGHAQLDEEGYPSWLKPSDRILLEAPTPAPASAPASASAPAPSTPDAIMVSNDAASAPSVAPTNPDVVVSQDGSGDYKSIQAAVDNIPSSRTKRWVIYIKAGVYKEYITLLKSHTDVTFIGDGIGKTIITGNRNVALQGYTTFKSATVALGGSGFIAKGVTFQNTAGAIAHQAVALRASADYMVFDACSFEGYQDTLYAQASRQFYRRCDIYDTVDYIFGNAIAIFQDCRLLARKPLAKQKNTYTAHGRSDKSDPSGYSFQSCSVVPSSDLLSSSTTTYTYYGRPWRAYSRTVFIGCFIDKHLHPTGWLPWDPSNPFTDTLYYGEYKNTGPGSSITGRVKWGGVHSAMTSSEASVFAVSKFLAPLSWLQASGVAYNADLLV